MSASRASRAGGMSARGVIEGFYGPPWSHAERLDLISFCAQVGFNLWVHAPKGDPYHRARWREPYPEAELERLAALAAAAAAEGVRFAYAIAPGLDVCYSDERELETLLAKLDQLRSIGVREFQLLWDDVEYGLRCPEDRARYGRAASPQGAAQAAFSNRFAAATAQAAGTVVCPMDYAGAEDRPYRRSFAPDLDPGIVLYWTGPDVVSTTIDRATLELSVERYGGREHLLWDNYPANDQDPTRLHLGPLRGRDPHLCDGPLRGIVANPMVQAVPSKLALATIADWVREPYAYDPVSALQRALESHGAEVLEAVRRLTVDPAEAQRDAEPAAVPEDVASLAATLAPGVDAATAVTLLEPFV